MIEVHQNSIPPRLSKLLITLRFSLNWALRSNLSNRGCMWASRSVCRAGNYTFLRS